MEALLPILFALGIGFTHAFEADHLVAIMNIVTNRNKTKVALKDGIYWGLGHTTTVFVIGAIVILSKLVVNESFFGYLEGVVGFTLIVLGIFRLRKLFKKSQYEHNVKAHAGHKLAYGVGLIHGLAGSGAVIIIAMTEIKQPLSELFYLLSFGLGSIVGMLIAASIFSLPFSKQLFKSGKLQIGMVIFSSVLCLVYGGYMVYAVM